MGKIIMLGTGHSLVYDIFNTCFLMENNDEFLLVDTGGGAEILRRLKINGVSLKNLHNIFISHCHVDHILGLMWILKKMSKFFVKDDYKGKLNIYCNSEVAASISALYSHLLPKNRIEAINKYTGAEQGVAHLSLASAVAVSIGIAIQNIPEGAIISMPMRAEGNSRWRSFLIGSLSGAVSQELR